MKTPKLGGHPKFYEILDKQAQLHSNKNHDYSGGQRDKPLSNFSRMSKLMQLYPDMDWSTPTSTALFQLIRQLDAALILYSRQLNSKVGEPVTSRLNDIAVLANLAQILYEEEISRHKDPLAPYLNNDKENK